MGESGKTAELIDREAKESKAAYERPILRRVGWLRDVTAQASIDTIE
ncbi:hypothetical protein [Candidatus Methylomirabilis limnetica]|nr:hypothetical protein [Candidatus Methylomirabilis limnetica]